MSVLDLLGKNGEEFRNRLLNLELESTLPLDPFAVGNPPLLPCTPRIE